MEGAKPLVFSPLFLLFYFIFSIFFFKQQEHRLVDGGERSFQYSNWPAVPAVAGISNAAIVHTLKRLVCGGMCFDTSALLHYGGGLMVREARHIVGKRYAAYCWLLLLLLPILSPSSHTFRSEEPDEPRGKGCRL